MIEISLVVYLQPFGEEEERGEEEDEEEKQEEKEEEKKKEKEEEEERHTPLCGAPLCALCDGPPAQELKEDHQTHQPL